MTIFLLYMNVADRAQKCYKRSHWWHSSTKQCILKNCESTVGHRNGTTDKQMALVGHCNNKLRHIDGIIGYCDATKDAVIAKRTWWGHLDDKWLNNDGTKEQSGTTRGGWYGIMAMLWHTRAHWWHKWSLRWEKSRMMVQKGKVMVQEGISLVTQYDSVGQSTDSIGNNNGIIGQIYESVWHRNITRHYNTKGNVIAQ